MLSIVTTVHFYRLYTSEVINTKIKSKLAAWNCSNSLHDANGSGTVAEVVTLVSSWTENFKIQYVLRQFWTPVTQA